MEVPDCDVDESELLDALNAIDDESEACALVHELMREAAAFRTNPVDVNTAVVEELARVPFMDRASAECIVANRERRGAAHSLDELVVAGCLSQPVLERVRPYLVAVRRGEPASPADTSPEPIVDSRRQQVARGLTWRARLRLTGCDDTATRGDSAGFASSLGSFARLRVNYGDRLAVSAACERDPGERGVLDHAVAGIMWRGEELTLGVGDFVGTWGQGLLMGRGGFPTPAGYPRTRSGLKTYDGASESSARRGAFADAARGRVRVQMLAASTGLDASVDDRGRATVVRTSGLHCTDSERAGAGALREALLGARATVSCPGGIVVSASALQARYSPPLAMGDDERRRFAFSGSVITLFGVDAVLRSTDTAAGCEVAGHSDGGIAAVAGFRARRGGAVVRAGGGFLSRDYWSPIGRGIPGFSGGSNGAAGWVGLDYRPTSVVQLDAELRVTGRPWRSYHLELPDRSTSLRTGGSLKLNKIGQLNLDVVTRVRTDVSGESSTTSDSSTRRIRASLRLKGRTPLVLTATTATTSVDHAEVGSLLAVSAALDGSVGQDITWKSGVSSTATRGSPPVTVQYEPGLPGEFSLRSLNTPGTRWYIRVHTELPLGPGVTLRAAGGPLSEQLECGIMIEAGGSRYGRTD